MSRHGMRHFVGVDLGPASQFSALAVLERRRALHGRALADVRPPYALRHLERFPPGTPYPHMAASLLELLRTPDVSGAVVGLDVTGVGRAVQELFFDVLWNRVYCTLAPVTVVGSAPGLTGVACGLVVPKLELVGTIQVLLQTQRLKIAAALPEAAVLVRELEAFRAAPPVLRGESVELWRERDHDDLVLAVAVAAWLPTGSGGR